MDLVCMGPNPPPPQMWTMSFITIKMLAYIMRGGKKYEWWSKKNMDIELRQKPPPCPPHFFLQTFPYR